MSSSSKVWPCSHAAGSAQRQRQRHNSKDAYATSLAQQLSLPCSSIFWTSFSRGYRRSRELLRTVLETVFVCFMFLLWGGIPYSHLFLYDRIRSLSLYCISCFSGGDRSSPCFLSKRSISDCFFGRYLVFAILVCAHYIVDYRVQRRLCTDGWRHTPFTLGGFWLLRLSLVGLYIAGTHHLALTAWHFEPVWFDGGGSELTA